MRICGRRLQRHHRSAHTQTACFKVTPFHESTQAWDPCSHVSCCCYWRGVCVARNPRVSASCLVPVLFFRARCAVFVVEAPRVCLSTELNPVRHVHISRRESLMEWRARPRSTSRILRHHACARSSRHAGAPSGGARECTCVRVCASEKREERS